MGSPLRSVDRASVPRLQFSIREVLVATLIVAIGLTLYRLREEVWPGAIRIAQALLSIGIVWGLGAQIRDFRRELGRTELSGDARWGLWFAIASRIGVVVLLAAYHLIELLAAMYPRAFLRGGYLPWGFLGAGTFPHLVLIFYCLALVIVLSGTRQLAGRRQTMRPTVLRYVGYGLVGLVGAALLSYLLHEWLVVHFFAHRSLSGIEGRILVSQGLDVPDAASRAKPAFWLGIGTVIVLPLNYLLIYLSTREESSPRRSKLARLAFALAFPALAGMFFWNYFVALPHASPLLIAQASNFGMWEILLIGLPCFVVLTTTIAYRWSVGLPVPGVPVDEPRVLVPYLHERRWLLALLAMTLIMEEVFSYVSFFDDQPNVSWNIIILDAAAYPTQFALLAALILVVRALFARWRLRRELPPTIPPELPLARFLFTWLAVAATTLVALPALAAYGFALCLAPWYF